VYPKCSAYLSPERPCWENAYTQNEILIGIKETVKFVGFSNSIIWLPLPPFPDSGERESSKESPIDFEIIKGYKFFLSCLET